MFLLTLPIGRNDQAWPDSEGLEPLPDEELFLAPKRSSDTSDTSAETHKMMLHRLMGLDNF